MVKGAKREFILEGLDCAHCAATIESGIQKIDGVASAAVAFATRTMTIEARDGADMEELVSGAHRIIKKLEPDITVKEKTQLKPAKKILALEGLNCSNCAAKIEKEVSKIPGVKSAFVDFVSKKLAIEALNEDELGAIGKEASNIACRIESGIRALEEEKMEEHDEAEGIGARQIIRFAVGAVLFLVALLFRLPFWVEFGISFTGYILVGGEVLVRAAKNIARGRVFDENFLMSVATIGAFAIGQFPEGVAVMLFYQIGELFQDIAVNRSRKSIADLMDIRPDFANLKVGDDIKKVTPGEVKIGDTILVRPGEKVPLDGKVIEGKSMLDMSALTGESVPRKAEAGSYVLSGSINKNGLLAIEVAKAFGESTVSKILDLVQNASSKKAPTENFITRFARYYTPIVVIAAAALAVIPPLLVPGATFPEWINRALVFLVISCPCALVVSIPLGFFGGIGGASRSGILIKGSNYLEALNGVDTVVFDKTGTLTRGVFKVTMMQSSGVVAESSLLEYAAYAESFSNHPIALSIKEAYGKEIDKNEITDYDEISGHGIKAKVKGRPVLAGNAKLMAMENITFNNTEAFGTVVHLAVDGSYAGYIVISDEIKKDSKNAVKALRDIGVRKLVMLTGDNKAVGEKIGGDLGLDEVYSELLPDQKVEWLERLDQQKQPKGKLIFVGDGINDAPVLARADVGVAMGGVGSDAAIEAADVVLMTDEPSKLVSAIKIARRTRRLVWQNILFAMAVKGIVLLMGAGGIANIWEAVFADVGVALLAVLNAIRAMKV